MDKFNEREYTNEDIVTIMQKLSKYDLALVKSYLPKLCHVEFIGPEVHNYGGDEETMKSCIHYHQEQKKMVNSWVAKLENVLSHIENLILERRKVLPDFFMFNEKNQQEQDDLSNRDKLSRYLVNVIVEVADGNGYVSAPTYQEFIEKYQSKIEEANTKLEQELEHPLIKQAIREQTTFLKEEEERYQQFLEQATLNKTSFSDLFSSFAGDEEEHHVKL